MDQFNIILNQAMHKFDATPASDDQRLEALKAWGEALGARYKTLEEKIAADKAAAEAAAEPAPEA